MATRTINRTMIRKQVEIYEKDYERLLMLAGSPENIANVVSCMVSFVDETSRGFCRIYGWDVLITNSEKVKSTRR